MRTGFLVAILSACMAVGLFAPHRVNADGPASGLLHGEGACNNWARVPHSLASCMHAWWNNSPPVSEGWGAGSTFGVQNYCGLWGTTVAHIDVKSSTDKHIHMVANGAHRAGIEVYDVRDITCCMDESDLCSQNQVIPVDGWIGHVVTFGSYWTSTTVDVSTHRKRYDFCRGNGAYVYCQANASGDVWTEPAAPLCADDSSCNCGDHFCTEDDCDAAWDDISAVRYHELTSSKGCTASDHDRYVSTIDATDGTSQSCTITAGCGTGSLTNTWDDAGTMTSTTVVNVVQFTADVDDISGHYNCHGKLRTPNCHGTVVSTHLEEYSLPIE